MRYYRVFEIPKGSGKRRIEAPKVALKLIQKWLSVHFERKWQPNDAVHGFVRGRSHITAAQAHLSAQWVASIDIENFFPSTSAAEIRAALMRLGYQSEQSLRLITSLCCLSGRLAQGAPSSPVLSNVALDSLDFVVAEIARRNNAVFTRYADDIVLSGKAPVPTNLLNELKQAFAGTTWKLSSRKEAVTELPQRLKVHGLLVHGNELRLTKGYRNRIRALRHLDLKGAIAPADAPRVTGHLNFASLVERQSSPKKWGQSG